MVAKEKKKYVRGILCWKCNEGLKYFNNNPESLTKASKYITKFEKRRNRNV